MADRTTTDRDFQRHVDRVTGRLDDEWRKFRNGSGDLLDPGNELGGALLDQARLEITEWMRRSRRPLAWSPPHGERPDVSVPSQRGPVDDDQPVVLVRSPIRPDRRWTDVRPPPANYPIDSQVGDLGRLLTIHAWDVVRRDPEFADQAVRKKLAASHFWCDLFVACARALAGFQGLLAGVPGHVTATIRSLVERSGTSRDGRSVELLIGPLVERIWESAMAALDSAFPALAVLRGPEAVRAFRILALLCCPDPRRHAVVLRHAVRPLAEDAFDVLTERTVARLRDSLAEQTGWHKTPDPIRPA